MAKVKDPLYQEFSSRGVPREGERGYTPDPSEKWMPLAEYIYERAMALWQDPEAAPWLYLWLRQEGVYDTYLGDIPSDEEWQENAPIQIDELPDLIGLPGVELDFVADLYRIVAIDEPDLTPEFLTRFIAWQLADLEKAGSADKPRLVLVSKDVAFNYIREHHSKLEKPNFRGLMYTFGVKVRDRLVAVGTGGHPTSRFPKRSIECPLFGMLELTRIASDGTVRGASSMIASRMIDLLPHSGRRGVAPCLFITYSLITEKGTTYLALVDKGLRPTEMTAADRKPSGARKSSGLSALPHLAKIRWEVGPKAMPPDWSLLLKVGNDPERVEGAARAFAAWEAREEARAAKMRHQRPKSALSATT